ncbi:MAG TPA: FkbM family methyltransferase [Pseudolabrys sp.]|nr:FkbM family methyltransferase [Pseudolabrys sp.]
MRNVGRKLAFVLASSNHGTMIINRLDYRMSGPDRGIGVGYQLLEAAAFDPVEVELALQLIEARKRLHGDGVVAIDGGANIGVHTIEWAAAMTGWGSVIAIEAQERIYYALAGNIAINNCFNAIAMHAAISSEPGIMLIPTPDYLVPSSFGSLELKPRAETEFIGQPIDYSAGKTVAIQKMSIDALSLPRVDFIKLDVEGMELEALEGARQTIERSRPIFLVESIKASRERLRSFLNERGYKVVEAGINLLAIHKSDPVVNELQIPDMPAQSSAA